MTRLATSPTQKTGIETPIRLKIIKSRSSRLPCVAAAISPIRMAPTTHKIAAPATSESVHRCRLDDLGDHLLSAIDEGGEIAGHEQAVHEERVLHRERAIEPEAVAHRRERLRRGVAAGDPGRRVGAGRGEEDQENEDADPKHHEGHLQEAAKEGGDHRGGQPIRTLARGSSASRTPSPRTLRAKTVTAMAMPGARATIGRV